jgi:hypothetical protein
LIHAQKRGFGETYGLRTMFYSLVLG